MDLNQNGLNLAGLSISENGPKLTSRTPPPPGFNGAGLDSERKKSTSFNNLAMALGTGLAESMENSTSEQQGLQQQRIPTPSNVDNYTRQSRHLASRLVGGGTNGGTGGMRAGGGFDYLNPSGTGHLLIPPSNNSFLEKLKAERESAGVDTGRQQMTQDNGDFLSSLIGSTGNMHSTSMNTQAQENRLDNTPTKSSQSGLNENQHLLTQELLRHQMWQQNNSTNNYKANMQPIGVTVVEPSSRNSPAPRSIAVNGSGLMYPVRDGNVGNGSLVGSNTLGSLNVQGNNRGDENLNERQSFVLGNGTVNFAPPPTTEGRASAPPINSQQPGGVINVGLGANNAALRALQTSSLQMRVAELHQQLGANGNNNGSRIPTNATINLRAMPGGKVIVLASPPPNASQVVLTAPSREATPMDRNSPRPQMHMSSVGTAALPQLSRVSPEQKERERAAVEELTPYLRDPPKNQKYQSNSASNTSSRGVAVLYASQLAVADVKSTCEAFGTLEAFRSDFAESKGVYFVTFYDLRSARLAIAELPKALNQMVSASGSEQIEVKYCVPLNSSTATDESMLLVSNLPGTIDEQDINQAMSSFGEIRNVHYQAGMSDDDSDRVTYLVEFYDIQDARQALMELEHSTPWGTDVVVKVGSRNPTKRKQGKELFVLMSSWRQGLKADSANNFVSPSPSPKPPDVAMSQQADVTNQMNGLAANSSYAAAQVQQNYQYNVQNQDFQQQYSTQLVVGPDGNYMYVLVPNQPQAPAPQAYGFPGQMVIDPHAHQHQQYMYQNQQYVQNPQHLQMDHYQIQMQYNNIQGSNHALHVQDSHAPPTQFVRLPSDMNTWNSGSLSSGSGQSPAHLHGQQTSLHKRMSDLKSTTSHGSGSSSGNRAREDEHTSLSLDIESVRHGRDTRSSLMVRNIPNKYTQKMLLAEFAESGHASDKMDFFYLPIDFKNKCNRGYAFVNFVDYKDIIPFFDAYNGNSWSKFNSDKICDITYARIQGKAAMLKRFENSALMEKDDEYRPMVFVSHGERKGQLEAMTMGNMNMRW
ncbi:hypothetical protein ACHAWO_007053 [Cyclotella atomus]|uniref:RRM domain-containing protein n=1 Tax=Cyclotella atomus TaxID=382360 RepID=A0ABD3NYT4_9STRA